MLVYIWKCDLCPTEKRTRRPVVPSSWSVYHDSVGETRHSCPEHPEEKMHRRDVWTIARSVIEDILTEDPSLSDRAVADIAQKMGHVVSHVTVIRFRVRQGIPPARVRRALGRLR